MNTKQHTEFLKYTFSADELREIGLEMARDMQKKTRITSEKKQVVKDYDAQLAASEATLEGASTKLNNGYEMRETECEVTFDEPEEGMKTIVRLDSGAVVREAKMEQWEKQEELKLAEALK